MQKRPSQRRKFSRATSELTWVACGSFILLALTSAFAPKHYPEAIIKYANSRGADKIIYAGYFPMGLTLERIFRDMPHVPFKDEVWPKFLYGNAARVLKMED